MSHQQQPQQQAVFYPAGFNPQQHPQNPTLGNQVPPVNPGVRGTTLNTMPMMAGKMVQKNPRAASPYPIPQPSTSPFQHQQQQQQQQPKQQYTSAFHHHLIPQSKTSQMVQQKKRSPQIVPVQQVPPQMQQHQKPVMTSAQAAAHVMPQQQRQQQLVPPQKYVPQQQQPVVQAPPVPPPNKQQKFNEPEEKWVDKDEVIQKLDTTNPLIPLDVVMYYLNSVGFNSSDPRAVKLVALAAENFVNDIAAASKKYIDIGYQDEQRIRGTLDTTTLLKVLENYGLDIVKPTFSVSVPKKDPKSGKQNK